MQFKEDSRVTELFVPGISCLGIFHEDMSIGVISNGRFLADKKESWPEGESGGRINIQFSRVPYTQFAFQIQNLFIGPHRPCTT